MDGNGKCEILVANPSTNRVFFRRTNERWEAADFVLPSSIVDAQGRDAGLRFVDLNADQRDDVVVSNDAGYGVYVFASMASGWDQVARQGFRDDKDAIPWIVHDGKNMGAWFADDHMWVQNEFTDQLPDGVDKVPFVRLLGQP